MKKQKFKFKGDTPIGRLLQNRADRKRDEDEIEEYLKLDSKNLTDEQLRIALQDISEKHHEQ